MKKKFEKALTEIANLDQGKTNNPAVKIARDVLYEVLVRDKTHGVAPVFKAEELTDILEGWRRADITEMDDDELRPLSELLHHWSQLMDREKRIRSGFESREATP